MTQARYRACVEAGACRPPSTEANPYWDQSGYDDYPIDGVTWVDADNYCKWADLRLPTEAEWEKAARGTDGRTYPWGEEAADQTRASYSKAGIRPVGNFPDGASPYGALDMTGNVWEWVADWYAADAYFQNGLFNPVFTQESEYRIERGASAKSDTRALHTSVRAPMGKNDYHAWLGFRCARDAEGQTSYPRFQGIALQTADPAAGYTADMKAELLLDRPMEETGFSQMYLDLTPAGVDATLELVSAGAGRYLASGTVAIPASGRYQLPVRVTGPNGEHYQVCQLPLSVFPTENVAIYADELATGWTTTEREMESLDLEQTAVVGAGNAACALLGEKSFTGWQTVFEAPEPVSSLGYALRFFFHPGETVTGSSRFAVYAVPGPGIDLLKRVDLERKEWQVVEIPLEEFGLEEPLAAVSFSGTLEGTFYLDDIELVVIDRNRSRA